MPDLNTCPASTAGASASSSTGAPASSTGTSGSVEGPACVHDNIPNKLQVYNKIKKMKNWEDCRDACNADTQCNSFKHKKRACYLMEVVWVPKSDWISGEKFCV